MSARLLDGDSNLTVVPPVESAGYIRMTLAALAESGIAVTQTGESSWRIPGGQRYQAQGGMLHGDWSQAAALLCMGALGGDVTVTGLNPDSIQGDRAVLELLERAGAGVTRLPDGARAAGGKLRAIDADLRGTPDIAPMIALLCQLAEGTSHLSGCGRLRLKETDRLDATAQILNALGGQVTLEGDTLVITGVERLRGGVSLPPVPDHRMVMLITGAALVSEQPIRAECAESLDKSWPDYLEVYRRLGGKAQ